MGWLNTFFLPPFNLFEPSWTFLACIKQGRLGTWVRSVFENCCVELLCLSVFPPGTLQHSYIVIWHCCLRIHKGQWCQFRLVQFSWNFFCIVCVLLAWVVWVAIHCMSLPELHGGCCVDSERLQHCDQWKLKKFRWINSGSWLLMNINIKLWFGLLKCTTLWCNISSFAIEGVNLIDASILNSRLTYCVVQPFDSFQIILLLILTQPFIIICIQPTVLKALSWIVKLMFSNPIRDAFYMLICHTPYMSTCLQKKTARRYHSFICIDICSRHQVERILA